MKFPRQHLSNGVSYIYVSYLDDIAKFTKKFPFALGVQELIEIWKAICCKDCQPPPQFLFLKVLCALSFFTHM